MGKVAALVLCSFAEVLALDADAMPLRDPHVRAVQAAPHAPHPHPHPHGGWCRCGVLEALAARAASTPVAPTSQAALLLAMHDHTRTYPLCPLRLHTRSCMHAGLLRPAAVQRAWQPLLAGRIRTQALV